MFNLPFKLKKSALFGLAAAGILATSLPVQAQSVMDKPAATKSAAEKNSAATDTRGGTASAGSAGTSGTSGSSGTSGAADSSGASGSSGAAATGAAAGSSGASAAGSADTKKMDSTVAASDRKLMREIALANLAEIETAKMAESKSKNEEVKSFAKKMVDDHTQAQAELTTLAQAKGVQLPTEPDAKHKAAAKKMDGMSEAAFDKAYIKQAGMKDHSEVHKKLQSAAKQAKDPELKAYAEKTAPVVAEHLKMAKDMSGSKAGGSTSSGASGAKGSAGSGSSGASGGASGASGSGGSSGSSGANGGASPSGSYGK